MIKEDVNYYLQILLSVFISVLTTHLYPAFQSVAIVSNVINFKGEIGGNTGIYIYVRYFLSQSFSLISIEL